MRAELTGSPASLPRPAAWTAGIGLGLLLLSAASVTSADPDLWGHVRFGADLLQGAWLPDVDPYSFTQDRPWINHEWLSELMMGVAWASLGSAGLSLLKGILVLLGGSLVWASLGGVHPAARIVVMGGAVIGMAPLLHTLRPQLWTFVCLAALCRLLSGTSWSARWRLPLVFVVWANSHGGWIVGLGLLLAWAIPSAWRDGRWGRWTALLVASTVATLVTPYGMELWTFLVDTVRVTRPNIEEWRPLWTFGPARWLPWLAVVGATAWAARQSATDKWPRVLAVLVLAYGALRVVRVEPLLVEATVVLFAPLVARAFPAETNGLPGASGRDALVLAVALLLSGAGAAAYTAARSVGCITVEGRLMPEAEPVRALGSAGEGRLVTFFNWGEYAIWHLAPRLRVSMDGRRETVYSPARLGEHDAIVAGGESGLDALAAWRAEYVWLPAESLATRAWLEGQGYRVEYRSDRSFLAVRADLPSLSPEPGPRAASDRRCFPN